MNETTDEPQAEKSKLRRLAAYLPLLGFVLASALGIIATFIVTSSVATFRLLHVAVVFLYLSGISALVIAIISLLRLKCTRTSLLRQCLPEFAIIAVALFVILLGAVLRWGAGMGSLVICSMNLSGLDKTLEVYAHDYNRKYPTADRWCDLLVQLDYVTEQQFQCPEAERGRCHYAINPNADPNSSDDTVLLFETTAGWNQHGGPEILTTENHGGKGCNVLFNDGIVRFVPTEELDQLKWKRVSE